MRGQYHQNFEKKEIRKKGEIQRISPYFLKGALMKSETSTIKCKAIFSDDRTHRMLLRHEWEKAGKSAMIIMINPNTADTLNIDLTTMLTINNLSKLGLTV